MKKQIALAAVLAAVLTLTACGERAENKGGGSSSVSVTESSSKASDNVSVSKPGSDEPNAPSASDPIPDTSDTESSDSVIVISTDKDDLYEPVMKSCGEIVTYGDDQYFDSFTYYGTACTIVYRYYFTNGIFDHAEMRVKPNAIPDFKEIYDRHYVGEIVRYDYSDFVKESDDSWLLTNTTYLKEEAQFFEGADVNSLHGMMQSMADS